MNPFFTHHDRKNWRDPSEEHLLVPIHEPPHNTTEGSEFLDDALRMHEQPLIYTEESVAAGSPKNLL